MFTQQTVDAGQSCYGTGLSATISCQNGAIAPSDPGPAYKYLTCNLATCLDPTDPNHQRTLNAGTQETMYSVSSANCSQSNPQAYCNNHSVQVSCGADGGTATLNPQVNDPTDYIYGSCTVPPNCQQCTVNTQDAGPVSANVGNSLTLFSASTSQYCDSISAVFQCVAGQNGNPPVFVGNNGAQTSNYPYLNCTQQGSQGSGGGGGGGNGNSNGPGDGFKQRAGGGGGSGGGGLGCIDATQCSGVTNAATLPSATQFIPCLLPWGTAEVEFYGSFIAFGGPNTVLLKGSTDTVCVKSPDTCSNHRQSRTCQFPTLTGTTTYSYPNCVERPSCP